MISAREVMWGVVMPAVFSAAVMLMARWVRRWPALWSGVAVVGGYLIAHVGLFGWPTWPISPARHGVALAAVVGFVGGAVIGMTCWMWWGRVALRAACVAVGMGLVGWKRFTLERDWSGAEVGEWWLMWIGAVVMWSALDQLAHARVRRDERGVDGSGARWDWSEGWLVSAATIGLSAPMVVIVGSALGEGQALGALAVTLLVGGVIGMTRWGSPMHGAGIGAGVMIVSTMWMSAAMWAGLPWWMAAGFCAAPMAGLVVDAPMIRPRRGWVRLIVRLMLVSAVVLAVGGPSAVRELRALAEESEL